jgi:hypothetical protein
MQTPPTIGETNKKKNILSQGNIYWKVLCNLKAMVCLWSIGNLLISNSYKLQACGNKWWNQPGLIERNKRVLEF